MKDKLNKNVGLETLEAIIKQELEQDKFLKSKTLTKDFIEKIEKCKTNEELKVAYIMFNSYLDLNIDDNITLFNLYKQKVLKEKQDLQKEIQILQKTLYEVLKDRFYKELEKKIN